jgi:hypothetical protein
MAEHRDPGHGCLGNEARARLDGFHRARRRRGNGGEVDRGVFGLGVLGERRRSATARRGGEHRDDGAGDHTGDEVGHLANRTRVHRRRARDLERGRRRDLLESRALMRASRILFLLVVLLALLSMPVAVLAQETPTPGVTPEEVRSWTFYLFAIPVALLTLGVVALIGLFYFRYSTRFFAREEPPATPVRRRRPQFAGVATAPRVEQVAAASTTPPAPPAAQVQTAAEQVPETRPAETEAAPEPAAAEPAAEPAAPAPARPAAEHVEPDQETYERELKAQLDKGVDRRVAEGRAKAAAIRAARAGASGAAEAPAQQVAPEEAEAATEAGKDEAPQAKEPEVPPPAPPEAEAQPAEEAPATVKAPRPEPAPPAAEEGPPATVPPGADEETFTRVLEEQLAKGLARPIAESRARAAAVKAAREKADAGSS